MKNSVRFYMFVPSSAFIPLVSTLVDSHSNSESKRDPGVQPKTFKNYRKIPLKDIFKWIQNNTTLLKLTQSEV